MPTELRLSPASVATRLFTVMLALLIESAVARLIFHATGHDVVKGFVPLFSVGGPESVPTFFQAALLLGAGLILIMTWSVARRQGGAHAGRWMVLALTAIFMAVDESTRLHRWIGLSVAGPLQSIYGGTFQFGWAIPNLLLTLVLGSYLLPLIRSLSSDDRKAMLTATGVYLAGAIVLEAFRMRVVLTAGPEAIAYSVVLTAKAALEMSGAILFIRALLARAGRGADGTALTYSEG